MDNSILYMQQQAEQRVRRMQEQARRVLEQEEDTHPRKDTGEPHSHPQEHTHLPASPTHRHTHPARACPHTSGGSDQWMLLVLAVLLYQSGSRPELLIALLYLAL